MKKFKRKKILGICKFCGRIARYRFKNGSLCCCNHQSKCPVISKDHAEKMKGKKHTKETKDKIRQQKLENIGWKFLRYMDRIPSVNELKRDLQQI